MTSGARRTASRSIAWMRPALASTEPGATWTVPTGSRRSSMKAVAPRTWPGASSWGQDWPTRRGSGPPARSALRPATLSEVLKDDLPRLRDARGCRGGAPDLGQRLEQEGLGGVETVGGGGALIAGGREVLGQHVDGGSPGPALGKAQAAQAALGHQRPLGHAGEPGIGDPRRGDQAALEGE